MLPFVCLICFEPLHSSAPYEAVVKLLVEKFLFFFSSWMVAPTRDGWPLDWSDHWFYF
jgi:hypothetical protein